MIAGLLHPNIVPVHEVASHQGHLYFTMELMEGGSLAAKLAVAPLSARAAAEIVATLARAVHFAHERGFVHRDLKPANVLLTADGTPKICDFGLAKRLEGDFDTVEGPGFRTESGAILGTPNYMDPEQAGGIGQDVGPAADSNLAESHKQKELADDRYRAARVSMQQMVGRLDNQRLADVPRLQELRRELLEDSLAFYQKILAQSENPDPAVRLDSSFAYAETGIIQFQLGRRDAVKENLLRAMAILGDLQGERSPDYPVYPIKMASRQSVLREAL